MLAKTIIAFAGLVASAAAIQVTYPTKDAKLDFSETITIKWTSVNTDPSSFTLALVDQGTMDAITISDDVTTSDHQYSLTNFVATVGASYKFNILSNDPENTGILAQSQTFTITKSGGTTTSSSTSTSTSTTTTADAATATDTNPEVSAPGTSTTLTTKTTSSASKTGATATSSNTANASSTGAAATKSNAAVALDRTFGVVGGLFAGLLMLF